MACRLKGELDRFFKTIFYLAKLMMNRRKRCIVFFMVPCKRNLGDHAIVLAERRFLAQVDGYKIIEVPDEVFPFFYRAAAHIVSRESVIMVNGGGFLGTIWKGSNSRFIKLIRQFTNNRIIVFPQTIYYGNNPDEQRILEADRNVYRNAKNLFVCVRERNSYDFFERERLLSGREQCILTPDIVLSYSTKSAQNRMEHVLLCFRKDREIRESRLEFVRETCECMNIKTEITDTVHERKLKDGEREREVERLLDKFRDCSLVITDRLHGMILAAITGTPCLFFDNCSKKVSGVYDTWLKEYDYIRPAKEEELQQQIQEMRQMHNKSFDTQYFRDRLKPILECLEGR